METMNATGIAANEEKTEDLRRLPRLFRLDEHVLTQMLLSRKPIVAVAKSILEPKAGVVGPGSSDASSVQEGQECFFFHARWQAVC
jgi:hypothetical protein